LVYIAWLKTHYFFSHERGEMAAHVMRGNVKSHNLSPQVFLCAVIGMKMLRGYCYKHILHQFSNNQYSLFSPLHVDGSVWILWIEPFPSFLYFLGASGCGSKLLVEKTAYARTTIDHDLPFLHFYFPSNDNVRTVGFFVPGLFVKVFIDFKGVDIDSGNQLASIHRLIGLRAFFFVSSGGKRCCYSGWEKMIWSKKQISRRSFAGYDSLR